MVSNKEKLSYILELILKNYEEKDKLEAHTREEISERAEKISEMNNSVYSAITLSLIGHDPSLSDKEMEEKFQKLNTIIAFIQAMEAKIGVINNSCIKTIETRKHEIRNAKIMAYDEIVKIIKEYIK